MTNIISPTIPRLTPKTAILTYVLLASIKWLLIPSYRSTDFDVHRNWLAITHHLPLSEWYFTTNNNTTVHTLDYPPGFAHFEYALSNNGITSRLLVDGWLDQRCFELLPDVTASIQSMECIRFHRGTVICIGDILFFIGAYFFATTATTTATIIQDTTINNQATTTSYLTFFLIVSNPGLIILDHIHFQYNGMLLGLLLLSISCMVRGASVAAAGTSSSSSSSSSHRWELLSAAIYAVLLTMKHLYITLAPLYFFYLLRRHCFVVVNGATTATIDNDNCERKYRKKKSEKQYDTTTDNNDNEAMITLQFSYRRFVILATVTLPCLIGPFIPFLLQSNPKEQIQQILKRLFPFDRGLVHDYWAANIWSIYLFGSKVATVVVRKIVPPLLPLISDNNSNAMNRMLEYMIPFPIPQPRLVAIILLLGLCPGGIYLAWKIGTLSLLTNKEELYNPGKFFIHAVVFCSLSSFMVGYHVHEKAIMTAIIPMTLLATTDRTMAHVYIRTCTFGIFGILPLLYRPEELLVKVTLYIGWLCMTVCILEMIHLDNDDSIDHPTKRRRSDKSTTPLTRRTLLTNIDHVSFVLLACILLFMEIIHPLIFMPTGRMEFLPLLLTSVTCAMGVVGCWLESYKQMMYAGSIIQHEY